MNLLGLLMVLVMAVTILLIPLGLPGLWILVALTGLGVAVGQVSGWVALAALALAAAAELAEWLVVQRLNVRYGGSPRAFWGALLGGFIGVLAGAPLPIVGSIAGGFAGSFLGAFFMTYHEFGDLDAARRVGWGVLVARTLAVGLKVAVAFVILVLGGGAWVVR